MVFGYVFFSSTVQTKNVFRIFYHYDYARLIAESSVEEFRGNFSKFVANDPDVKNLIDRAAENTQAVLGMDKFPNTSALAKGFSMAGKPDFQMVLSLRDIDKKLTEGSIAVKYGNEYQATLKIEVKVGITFKGKTKNSRFVFDHDLKHVCLRSDRNRAGKGYSTNSLNDYVLYVRDAFREFEGSEGKAINNDDFPLVIEQGGGVGKTGKIFFGCGKEADPAKSVFLNVNDSLESRAQLIPQSPSPVEVNWTEMKKYMPAICNELETTIAQAEKDANDQGANISLDCTKVKSVFSFEYSPITGDRAWEQGFISKNGPLLDRFKESKTKGTDAQDRRELNFNHGIKILGLAEDGGFAFGNIEGNLRQRFWQTVSFSIDVSEISGDPQIQNAIKQKAAGTMNPVPMKYLSPKEMTEVSQLSSNEKEIYKLVDGIQKTKSPPVLLMSQPNGQFAFRPRESFDNRNPRGALPDLTGPTGSKINFSEFIPFASYILRSQIFNTSDDLYKSGLYDEKENLLTLSGIIAVSKDCLVLKKDLRYRGAGVLVGLHSTGIRIEGNFQRFDTSDGPCIVYTYSGDIVANSLEAGKIEASLIALNSQFPAGKFSKVDFSGKQANVFGNLIVDRLNLESMASRGSLGQNNNVIAFDFKNFLGDDNYSTSLGGRLRAMTSIGDE